MAMPSHMTFRIDREIQKSFVHLCEQRGTTASIVIREFIDQQLNSTDAFSRWLDAGNAMKQRHSDEKERLIAEGEALDVRHKTEKRKAEALDTVQQIEVDMRHSKERRELDTKIEAVLERQDGEKFAHKHQKALAA